MSDDNTASKEVTASRNYYKSIAQELQEFARSTIVLILGVELLVDVGFIREG
jgi:hypothetical protein